LIHAGIADAYAVMGERGPLPPAKALAKARQAAERAISLDSRLAEAYVSLGHIVSMQDRDFETAERHFRRALELNPNLAAAHQWYSYMLGKQRRFEESLYHARKAVELDPVSNASNNNLAVLLFYARNQEGLMRQCERMLDLDPKNAFARMLRAWVFAWRGDEQAAFKELDAIGDRPADHPLTLRVRTDVAGYLGRRDIAKRTLDQLLAKQPHGGIPSTFIASGYAALGEENNAFQWLNRAYLEKDGLLSLIQVHPTFDGLRDDPRYKALVGQLGFKERLGSDSAQSR
jgi:tetratricopeptide (TPR) repeat protein